MSTVCEVIHVEQRKPGRLGNFSAAGAPKDRLWILCLIFPALLAVWFAFDHSWPFWDAADHVRVEFRYAELLEHARPWRGAWIQEFMTVNYCYPATIHIFNGALKAVFGVGRWVDGLSLVIFSLVLNFSVFGIARMIFKPIASLESYEYERVLNSMKASTAAVVTSLIVINCYPLISNLSHLKLLDYPHVAMFCFAMWSLLSWRQKPSWTRALVCGSALAVACTTKQIASFYLIAPCLVLLFEQCRNRNGRTVLQLVFAGACVTAGLALWVGFNWHDISAYMSRNSGLLGQRTLATALIPNLNGYLNCFVGMMGYPLMLLAGIGFVSASKKQWKELFLIILAAVVGFACMVALPFQLPEHRYIAPVLLAPALFSGIAASQLYENRRRLVGVLSSLVVAVAFCQFLVGNYCPYPVSAPKWLIHAALGVDGDRRGALEPSYHPTPSGDPYGQEWVVQICDQAAGQRFGSTAGAQPVAWLNLLPSTPELSVHTLDLVNKYKSAHVRLTTPRLWTPVGDRIDFNEQTWSNYEFYATKTGNQGLQFDSDQSAQNYKKLEDLLESGQAYKLIGRRKLADESVLSVFQKVR